MFRGVVFLALVGGAGFSAWTSFQDSSRNPLDWAVGEVHAMVNRHEGETAAESTQTPPEAEPIALQTGSTIPDDRFTISRKTLAAITCGPWDISDVGIEAILEEMIRRGWTPPSGARALRASHRNGGVAEAIDPDAPTPVMVSVETPRSQSGETQPPADLPTMNASTP